MRSQIATTKERLRWQSLRCIDPWKSINEVQSANRTFPPEEIERAVAKAVKAVRKSRRG
jgi:hypothetical protein